jgi:CheY-like chemotaxis protein
MTLHDVWVIGVGFGCGVLWLGLAFMLSHRLRDRQPAEASDIGPTSANSTRRSADSRRRTAGNPQGETGEPEFADRRPSSSPRARHEPSSGRSGSETILLMEDDAGIRAVVQRILGMHGYTVLAAATPVEALELSTHHAGPIHLLLTDLLLPETSGRRVAELLLRRRPGLPVLFMSGYTDDAIVHQGWLDSDTEVLQKPFTSESLLRRARQVLDQSGAGRIAAGA